MILFGFVRLVISVEKEAHEEVEEEAPKDEAEIQVDKLLVFLF